MKRKFLLWMGRVTAAGGVLIALAWWLVMVPWLETSGRNWNEGRSPHGFWRLKQRCLKLGLWQHDDGSVVGRLGGKEWVEPLVSAVARGEGLSCSGGHRDSALEGIANRATPNGADPTIDWPKWWAANKEKSQEDWILDGFHAAGVHVSLPASNDDFPKLLRVLGEIRPPADEWEVEHPRRAHPGHLRYNAFRWLRDSGFDPVKFLLESEPSKLDDASKRGIAAFQDQLRWLEHGPVSPLSFTIEPDEGAAFAKNHPPAGLTTKAFVIANASSGGLIVVGLAVMWLARQSAAAASRGTAERGC